jgi:aryl-alcohol dehydrogenase-like predicted oxidoreductase
MKLNRLGHSELLVSELCLGTMTFGQQNTAQEAEEQLDRAVERGINFIDAAEMYPVPARAETQGRTESIVGDWLTRKTRDRVIVATKIAGQGRPITWLRNGSLAVNRQNVRTAVEASLKRLKTDYIDLYQIHWPDRYVPMFGKTAYEPEEERSATPIAEQLAAFADVAREGKIRYVGLSNETAWGVSEFSRIAAQEGLPQVVALLAYSPLAFGVLSGKHQAGPAPGSRLALFDGFGQRYGGVNVAAATQAYVALAEELQLSPAKLALAFVRSRWFVASTIIGATTRAQLEENLSSLDVTLDASALARIDAIHARYPSPAP